MELFDRVILERIGTRILRRKETVAVAESVTAGLLQYSFSSIPDAALFFQGGLTAYNLSQKYKHLQVEPIHAASVNCVSLKVAREMALHVCSQFSSDWGIGITGYATPVPESGKKLFAFFAIGFKGKIIASGKILPGKGTPANVQLRYVKYILKKFSSKI